MGDFLKKFEACSLCYAFHWTVLESLGHSKVTTCKIDHNEVVLIVRMVFLSLS